MSQSLASVLALPLHKQATYADHKNLNNNFATWTVQTLGTAAYLILYSDNITTRLRAQNLKHEFTNWYFAKSSWCTLL